MLKKVYLKGMGLFLFLLMFLGNPVYGMDPVGDEKEEGEIVSNTPLTGYRFGTTISDIGVASSTGRSILQKRIDDSDVIATAALEDNLKKSLEKVKRKEKRIQIQNGVIDNLTSEVRRVSKENKLLVENYNNLLLVSRRGYGGFVYPIMGACLIGIFAVKWQKEKNSKQ